MGLIAFTAELVASLYRERRCSQEAVHAVRDRRLRALVKHARATSTLWRDRLAHVDPAAQINLAQIEPITKAELMASFGGSIAGGDLTHAEVEAFVRDKTRIGVPLKGRYMVATTSGTTGRVGYFVTDVRSFSAMNGVLMARVLRDRLVPTNMMRFAFGRRYRMAMAIATEGHFISRLVAGFTPLLGRLFINMRPFSIVDPMEKMVVQLNRFRPHYLHGYPTFLEALAHDRLQGRLAIDPEFVSLGSEPFSMSARRVIAQAFPRARMSETYGATECLAIANQCSAGRLHINEDVVIVEPVDGDGRPVPVGVPSQKVYITNLLNRAQPLLRYELGDSVTLLGDECPCGSSMASIRVEGRCDDTIYLQDGEGQFSAHPPVPFEALFLQIAGLRQYQLEHVRQNVLRVRVVPQPGADVAEVTRATRAAFGGYLASRSLEGPVTVEVETVERIERDERSHKIRQIYSQVAGPAGR